LTSCEFVSFSRRTLLQDDDVVFDTYGVNLNANFRTETRATLANRNVFPRVSPLVVSH